MKLIDLFSGCGGMSLGFQRAGFEICEAFDSWDVAAACYNSNFSHKCTVYDLSEPDGIIEKFKSQKIDGVIGGPPCQDFSHAGKRIEGSRADLTYSYAKIIQAIQPKFFVMENVDRASKSEAYTRARKIFKKNKYGLTERVLDASLCGVPQKRKRFFCIGILGESDGVLNSIIDNNLSDTEMTIRKYFKNKFPIESYYRHPRNYSRRAVFSIDEPSPTIRGVNRPVPLGYPGHVGDVSVLDGSVRPLTQIERARIQTFPEKFKWLGPKTHVEQMIGNAVPVDLAKFVGSIIRKYFDEK